jgi:hypothetical protein
MSPIAGDMLAITPIQRMQLDELQKDIDAHLDMLLTDGQKKQSAEPKGGGGYGGFSRPGQVMTGGEQNRLKLTDEQKKDLTALQKVVDGRFENVLTEAQRKQLKSVFAPQGAPPGITGGPNAAGPQPGKILSTQQQVTLKLSAEQKKRLAEIQKEIDARLDTLLTADQQKQLQTMRQNPQGVKTAAAPPGQGPAGGTPLFRAYRYGVDYPGLAGRKLAPGQLLEDLQPKEAEKKGAEAKK